MTAEDIASLPVVLTTQSRCCCDTAHVVSLQEHTSRVVVRAGKPSASDTCIFMVTLHPVAGTRLRRRHRGQQRERTQAEGAGHGWNGHGNLPARSGRVAPGRCTRLRDRIRCDHTSQP